MKKLLFIFLLVPFFCFGQIAPKAPGYFKIENGNVQYINVFKVDSLNTGQIVQRLMLNLATAPGVSNVQKDGELITGDLRNYKTDFKKFGGKSMGVWTAIIHPMDGKFTIQVKDGRYKLVIADLYCNAPGFPGTFTSYSTRKKATEFHDHKLIVEGMEYMNKDFTDRFGIKNNALSSEW